MCPPRISWWVFSCEDNVQTITEIDEALAHLAAVPENERGPAWYAYLNTLLDAKNKTKDNG